MKIDLPVIVPKDIKPGWEGHFELFSWYTSLINIPVNVFMVTTLKDNGAANVQLNAWGMIIGSGKEPKFILQVGIESDTYKLIEKTKEFVISIPSYNLKDKLYNAAKHYEEDTDEVLASGFNHEPSSVIKTPGIKECFAHYECVLDWMRTVEDDNKINALVQGKIVNAKVEEDCFGDTNKETFLKTSPAYMIYEPYYHASRTIGNNGGLCRLNTEDINN
ncbi:MAG: flavin reductase family protein [Bacillota bacterium]